MTFESPEFENSKSNGIPDRLLAAVLSPIVFNVSLVISVVMIFPYGSLPPLFNPYSVLYQISPGTALMATIILPFIAGLLLGMKGLTTLLGHYFYTHGHEEKDWRITLVAWAALLLLAYSLATMIDPKA